MTNAELGRRWARAWSRHDPAALSDLFDPDGEYVDVAFAVVSRGPGGARGWAEGFLAAFPDLVVDVVAEFATDGNEVVEWLMSATHLGQFDGLSSSRPALPGPRSDRSAHPGGPYRSLLGLLGPRDGTTPTRET